MTEKTYDDVISMLRDEFVDETLDELRDMELQLEDFRAHPDDLAEYMNKLRRRAHTIKGNAGVADFPEVAVVMHKMEDFVADLSAFSSVLIDTLMVFVDTARHILKGENAMSSEELARSLPNRVIEEGQDESDSGAPKMEALLVMSDRVASKLFERELQKLGIRATNVPKSFDAIEMVVRTRPDVVLVSAILDDLSGVDVANAITSMPKTSTIPACILTSSDRSHDSFQALNEKVKLIQKKNLVDDLKSALSSLNLVS